MFSRINLFSTVAFCLVVFSFSKIINLNYAENGYKLRFVTFHKFGKKLAQKSGLICTDQYGGVDSRQRIYTSMIYMAGKTF